MFVRTDGVDDAAVSVLSVIQAAQVSDGLSGKLVLPWEQNKNEIRQSTTDGRVDRVWRSGGLTSSAWSLQGVLV